jgi:PAB-dependent poly(A)-specific ribonuclease subunit 2
MCLTFDVSSSRQCMAFGDSAGSIHLFTSHSSALFNSFSRETEFADPVETLPPISITDEVTPLSTIPMPYCQGALASDWPEELLKKVYRYVLFGYHMDIVWLQ